MTQEVTEKGLDVDTSEAMRTTPEVERHPPMPRRDCHPAADGQPIVAVPVPDTRRLPLRRPSPPNIGDEQEPALIDEYEMGATSRGVFLSAAIRRGSSARSRPRRARRRVARASGNSSLSRSGPSRRARDDSARRTSGGSVRPRAAASTARFGTPLAPRRESATSPGAVSLPPTAVEDVPGSVSPPDRVSPCVDRFAASERPNSRRLRSAAPRPRDSGPTPTAEQHDDGASPVAWAYQTVA